jgi:hypothetical protein
MPTLDRNTTKFTKLRVAPKGDRSAVAVTRIDKCTVTLPALSNVATITTAEISIALPVGFSSPAAPGSTFDLVMVQPTAAMPAGLAIAGAYISAAGTAALGNPLAPANTPTAATLKIRFVNPTVATIDAAGVYNVLLVRG